MDILSLVGSVLRRWYVAVPIVLIGAIVAFAIQSNTPSAYQASGSVLLANPELDPSRLPLTGWTLDEVVEEVQTAVDEGAIEGVDEATIYRLDALTIGVDLIASSEEAAREGAEAVTAAFAEALAEIQEANSVPEADRTQVLPRATEVNIDDGDDAFASADGVLATSIIGLNDPTAGIQNPFGASAQTARVLEVALESDEGRLQIAAQAGRMIQFDIGQATRDVAPIVEITTFGTSPDVVLEDFDVVVAALGEELDARQARAQVPESRRVGLEIIDAPRGVEDVSPPVSRAAAAALGLAGLLGAGLALLVDGVARRRRDSAATGGDAETVWIAEERAADGATSAEPEPDEHPHTARSG